VLVLMSTSKTSLVSLMLGVAAIGFVWIARRGPAIGAAATWTGITGVMLLGAFILFASDVFFAILGKDATLTGRTKIWAAVMREIEDRPWLGYGYQAVWGDKSGWGRSPGSARTPASRPSTPTTAGWSNGWAWACWAWSPGGCSTCRPWPWR
jgi:O-antigen ligase